MEFVKIQGDLRLSQKEVMDHKIQEEVTNHKGELTKAKFKNKMNNVGVELTFNSTCEFTSKMQTKKPWQPN
jgi:hypothetical protein